MKELLFIVVSGFDIVGAVILGMAVFHPNLEHFTKGFKLGLVLAMLGLLGQAFRNYVYLSTGMSPTDAEVPLWAFKDLGISVFAMSWLWFKIKKVK
jgi:hypothetical protein